MSPEHANAIIVDDNKDHAATLRLFLIRDGHQVLAIAYSKEEGERLINKVKDGGTKIQVALLDGNLSETSTGGQDGRELAEQVRSQLPGVKVISISTQRQNWSDRPDFTSMEGSAAISKAVTEA